MSPLTPSGIEAARIHPRGGNEPRAAGLYVLYWMTEARRTFWNFALQHAARCSRNLQKPLVVCDPIHPGIAPPEVVDLWLDGFPVNAQRLGLAGVLYHPFLADSPEEVAACLQALARHAAFAVFDGPDAPQLEGLPTAGVDGVGLLLSGEASAAWGRSEERSAARLEVFRRGFQERVVHHWRDFPERNPLAKFDVPAMPSLLPAVRDRFPAATGLAMGGAAAARSALGWEDRTTPAQRPHARTLTSAPKAGPAGGTTEAQASWRRLLQALVEVETPAAGLADLTDRVRAYMDAGQLSAHQVLAETWRATGWTPSLIGSPGGGETGFWGLTAEVERMLDVLLLPHEAGVRGGRVSGNEG